MTDILKAVNLYLVYYSLDVNSIRGSFKDSTPGVFRKNTVVGVDKAEDFHTRDTTIWKYRYENN